MEKQGRRQQKMKKNTISKKSQKLLDKFNLLRACTWLNLSTMEKNKEYSITNIKRQTTQYGERLVVELDGVCKLSLPERYNTITDNQLKEIGKNKYNLLNRGSQGRSYKLELTPKSNQSERQEITKKYIIPKCKQNILNNSRSLDLSYKLELSLKSNSEGTSTIEQEVVKQPASM
jgi:hypothetical protein